MEIRLPTLHSLASATMFAALSSSVLTSAEPVSKLPLFRVVDLNIGQSQVVELHNGSKANVRLLDVAETRDSVRKAIRNARVRIEIDGHTMTLVSGNYHLPTTAGEFQVDCTATRGLYKNQGGLTDDSWGLERDARLRIWPAKSAWMPPGEFTYPLIQRWFASSTQMSNEPSYVDGGDAPTGKRIYYHSGLDIGGCEGLADVVAATDGVVVSAGRAVLPGLEKTPVVTRDDVVYIRDARDWYYRYSHLKSFNVQLGDRVTQGQRIGLLGKEGATCWSHLHFEIKSRQPSGKWGTEDGYAFLWEAIKREQKPKIIAVARPHHLIRVGASVTLDGSRSWSANGRIERYEWTFSDATTASGTQVERTYDRPGQYSEILKVIDAQGNVAFDFADVLVVDRNLDGQDAPTIHASYSPTLDIHPGDPVTFKVRSFATEPSGEIWDFADGSTPEKVRSDANANRHAPDGYAVTTHRFAKPGDYLVRVDHQARNGGIYTARLHVHVEAARVGGAAQASAVWQPWLSRELLPAEEAKGMMQAFVEKQIEPLPLPGKLDDWTSHREKLRLEILRILGIDDLVPAKWDLKLTNKGSIQREGYRIEKITFETYPGFASAALLYIPDGINERAPGIVSISGHTTESKAADYVQLRNVNLVKRGCVVLSYDYFGYGDRKTGDHPHHPEGPNSHGIRSFSYSRRTPTGLEVLDAIRAIDVLTSRPDIDPQRIGFTGESGGSNSTYWIAAVDPRVKLAVPVSSVTTFDYWIRGDINWDWHQRPPGIRRIADIGTLLALHAPDPLVIISSRRGTDDQEFPLHEAEKSHQWARHVYGLYDAWDHVKHYESTTAHGYQEDKRRELYLAVERWLSPPSPQQGQELPAMIETLEDLRCSLPENDHTYRSIYAQWLEPLPRPEEKTDPAALRQFLRERLGWPEVLPAVTKQFVSHEENGPWAAEFFLVETEPGIRLPVVFIKPKESKSMPAMLIPGRDESAVERALKRGHAVVAFDLRGLGETRSGKAGTWAWMAGDPWNTLLNGSGASWCNWSWFAGRPVPGQWALDIAQIARFSCEQFGAESVAIDADNDFGWSALLAAASTPETISSGTITIDKQSLHEDIRNRGDQALADVPGLLERLDIPQIKALWPGQVRVKP